MTGAAEFAAVFAQQLTDSARRGRRADTGGLGSSPGRCGHRRHRTTDDPAAGHGRLAGPLRRSHLRDGVDRATATDTVWALMDPALFCRLTGDRHWSPARFRRWFTDATVRLLLLVPGQQATAAVSSQKSP